MLGLSLNFELYEYVKDIKHSELVNAEDFNHQVEEYSK